jgi:hypothetical protein
MDKRYIGYIAEIVFYIALFWIYPRLDGLRGELYIVFVATAHILIGSVVGLALVMAWAFD